MIEARKQEEIAFHDKLREGQYEQRWSPEAEARVACDPLWSNFKYYAIERASLALSERWRREHGRGAVVLDYCCGNGLDAVDLARHGAARIVGIDISEVSIGNCRALARAAGVDDRVRFEAMDAEALAFPDGTFDLVTEYGVLHHLDLDRSMAEIVRVLKPGGHFLGTETLGHNPLIRWYRQRTPELRTEWEAQHILTRASFERMQRYFDRVELRFFHLATLAAVPLRRTPVFEPALAVLRAIDAVALRVPGLRWQAWQVVFRLSGPRKSA
ncbi:MAG: class I SAM-dependent methyltransferase [Acidobacteria bacterium]|nr:class I SAM-dependent methyltransferase [Acidobacteriota bacterium]